jgi:hypothetical protein
MHNPTKETQGRGERHLMTDPIGTRPTMRLNARVAGDMSLFEEDESADGAPERMVIWRWQLRRRRR